MNRTFITLNDAFNNPYFTLNSSGTAIRNVSAIQLSDDGTGQDIASLIQPLLSIERRASGPFQTDLSARDDVLLAFMSLILLLVLDSIIAAFLLRSKRGFVSNFGFSVKQIIELAREFSFQRIIPRQKRRNGRKVNVPLLIISVLILASSLGLEVAVLFLTNPILTSISNRVAAFRILQPVTAEWEHIRFHSRASINRPCEPFIFTGVEQGYTGINGCTQSSLDPTILDFFTKNTENRTLRIISDYHDFGADHFMSIGDLSANFSTRVIFVLGDKRSRFMRSTGIAENESDQVEFTHMQFLAYIFSIYARAIGDQDPDMNIDRLRDLPFSFSDTQEGPRYDILKLPGKPLFVDSRRYVTEVSGVIPDGPPVLRVAQHHFRGSAAVIVTDPDQEDLFLENGIETVVAEVWKEHIRPVNWLSLLIAITALLVALLTLRVFAKPVSTPDIASVYVKHAVGADLARGPMEISESESSSFRINLLNNDMLYRIGAETEEGDRYDIHEEYV